MEILYIVLGSIAVVSVMVMIGAARIEGNYQKHHPPDDDGCREGESHEQSGASGRDP